MFLCTMSFPSPAMEPSTPPGRPRPPHWVTAAREHIRPPRLGSDLTCNMFPHDSSTACGAQPTPAQVSGVLCPPPSCSSPCHGLFLAALTIAFLCGSFLLFFTTLQVLTNVWSSLTASEFHPELRALQRLTPEPFSQW